MHQTSVAPSNASRRKIRRVVKCVASSNTSRRQMRRVVKCVASSNASRRQIRRVVKCVASSDRPTVADYHERKRNNAYPKTTTFPRCVLSTSSLYSNLDNYVHYINRAGYYNYSQTSVSRRRPSSPLPPTTH